MEPSRLLTRPRYFISVPPSTETASPTMGVEAPSRWPPSPICSRVLSDFEHLEIQRWLAFGWRLGTNRDAREQQAENYSKPSVGDASRFQVHPPHDRAMILEARGSRVGD